MGYRLRVEDLVFDVVDEGPAEGPVVLLLHGFLQTSHAWRLVVPHLTKAGYRVIAPDQRGYSPGARPEGEDEYQMHKLLGDVLGIMDELGVDRAHVVGHEWGAGVAWQLASRHPDRVRTLTAISIPHPVAYAEALEHDPDQQVRASQLASFRKAGVAEEAMLVEGGLDDYLADVDPEVDVAAIHALVDEPGVLTAGLNWYRGMHRRDVEGLQKVSVPTLYVWSDRDPGIGRVAAETSGRYVEAAYRFEVFEGVSRFIPEAAADRLAELLLTHLD